MFSYAITNILADQYLGIKIDRDRWHHTSSMVIPYEYVHIDVAGVVSTMEITFSHRSYSTLQYSKIG